MHTNAYDKNGLFQARFLQRNFTFSKNNNAVFIRKSLRLLRMKIENIAFFFELMITSC